MRIDFSLFFIWHENQSWLEFRVQIFIYKAPKLANWWLIITTYFHFHFQRLLSEISKNHFPRHVRHSGKVMGGIKATQSIFTRWKLLACSDGCWVELLHNETKFWFTSWDLPTDENELNGFVKAEMFLIVQSVNIRTYAIL